MMTIASRQPSRMVKQLLQGDCPHRVVLFMGQAPALAEDAVSVLMKPVSGRHGRESSHGVDRGLSAGSTSARTSHPGSVFAYVLEGTVVSQPG